MLINIDHSNLIHIKEGVFAIPDIKWDSELVQVENGNSSVRKLLTNWENFGYGDHIVKLRNYINNPTIELSNPNNIEKYIIQPSIRQFRNNHYNLELIFHAIQLWGGNECRLFYQRKTQINFDVYENFVRTIIAAKNITEVLIVLKELIKATPNFNIAFATKHLSMWQHYTEESELELPIYDSVMSRCSMGKDKVHNQFIDLENYWNGFIQDFNHIKIKYPTLTINGMERQLFNIFRNAGKLGKQTNLNWVRFNNLLLCGYNQLVNQD